MDSSIPTHSDAANDSASIQIRCSICASLETATKDDQETTNENIHATSQLLPDESHDQTSGEAAYVVDCDNSSLFICVFRIHAIALQKIGKGDQTAKYALIIAGIRGQWMRITSAL